MSQLLFKTQLWSYPFPYVNCSNGSSICAPMATAVTQIHRSSFNGINVYRSESRLHLPGHMCRRQSSAYDPRSENPEHRKDWNNYGSSDSQQSVCLLYSYLISTALSFVNVYVTLRFRFPGKPASPSLERYVNSTLWSFTCLASQTTVW